MAWFTEFPVNAVKFISARLEDLCKTESNNISETSDLSVPRPRPFRKTLTPDTTRFGTNLSLLIVTLTGTHAGCKLEAIPTEDFTLTTSTRIVEYKFQKHGCP